MGLPYRTIPVDFRAPRTAEFLEVNPSGTLPAMRDGEVRMTESVAILQYLADAYVETCGPAPLTIKPGTPGYPDYLQFLVLGEAGLSAPMNAVIGSRFFGPEEAKDCWTVNMVIDGFFKRLQLVDRQLETRRYLAGDRFTVADISVAYALGLARMLELTDRMPARVVDYHDHMTARPAYKRAVLVGVG
jgi:glutathione S-transferase